MSRAHLVDASFVNADLRDASLRLATMSSVDVRGANLARTKFLFGPDKAQCSGVRNAEWAVYAHSRDRIPWPTLRFIGTFRLVGVSYLAVLGIMLYASVVRWANESLHQFQVWANDKLAETTLAPPPWLTTIRSLPVDRQLGIQLVMLVLLAAGATIYQLRCPDIIKENTEIKWSREMKEPLIEYRAAMYSQLGWRYLCSSLYVVGGVYTTLYLSYRVLKAITFLLFG